MLLESFGILRLYHYPTAKEFGGILYRHGQVQLAGTSSLRRRKPPLCASEISECGQKDRLEFLALPSKVRLANFLN